MFLAIVFIVIGLYLLLNALGIIVAGNFWGLLWAVIFLAIGIKMLARRGKCPICSGCFWGAKMHNKIHGKMHGGACESCDCEHEHHEAEDEEEQN